MQQKCTFRKTGPNYFHQYWVHCETCFPAEDEGACLECVLTCHSTHKLGEVRYGNFYCDCGEKECSFVKGMDNTVFLEKIRSLLITDEAECKKREELVRNKIKLIKEKEELEERISMIEKQQTTDYNVKLSNLNLDK